MKLNPLKFELLNSIKSLLMIMIMALTVFFVSCGDDDTDDVQQDDMDQNDDDDDMDDDADDDDMDDDTVTDDIVDLAIATDDLSTLVTALTTFDDLVTTLSNDDGTYTVFAPTNAAFADLLTALGAEGLDDIAEDDLREVLEYHVIAGSALLSTDLSDGATAETVQGASVTVGIANGTVSIDDATVTTADVEAINGVVHIIDAVLVPDGIEVVAQDIVDIALATEGLDSLVVALTVFDDLVEALSDQNGSYTVFAPSNTAFQGLLNAIGQSKIEDIPEDVLRRVLEYHVIGGSEILSTALSDGDEAETLLGESVTVGIAGATVTIDAATVTTADVIAANGVIHLVDGVLVPALEASIVNTIVQPAYFSKDFTILTEAVVTAGLVETLIDTDAEFTLFAPSDDAFVAAGITSLDGLTADDLEPILLYHVLGEEVFAEDLPETGSAVETLGGDFYLSINDDGVFINGTSEVIATDLDYDNGVVHVIDQTLIPATENIVEIAVAASQATEGAEFGQLVAALTAVEEDEVAADLITALSGDGPFTVFAPTDAAFQVLYDAVGDQDDDTDADVDDLLSVISLETLATVLQYHVIDGWVFSTDIPNALDLGDGTSVDLPTLASEGFDLVTFTLNDDLTITANDDALGIGLDDAAIIDTDILGTNGVIHVIDQVILP